MKHVIKLNKDHYVVGLTDQTGSGMTTEVSWADVADALRKAGVGRLREDEFFAQLELTERGITCRIESKK